jgi:esterase
MNLFYREAGKGTPLLILHGLFGSSDNWFSLSKVFAERFRVFTIDQRNHGQSPHTPEHNYEVLTKDLEEFVQQHSLQKPIIIGHSMGGKTAMNFALRNSGNLAKLIVVDIMPKAYPVHHDRILEGLKSIDVAQLKSRTEADAQLEKFVRDPGVRQFLLKSLTRKEDATFEWRINLTALDQNIESMASGLVFDGQYNGPTLMIKGAKSNYYAAGDEQIVSKFFPNTTWVTLDTSHWVQAEKPQEFADAVLNFIG